MGDVTARVCPDCRQPMVRNEDRDGAYWYCAADHKFISVDAPPEPADQLLGDLLEAFEAPNSPGRTCGVCSALADAGSDTKEALESALAGNIGRNRLARILSNRGYPTTWRTIESHKKGHQ
jgi:hypothetical protein